MTDLTKDEIQKIKNMIIDHQNGKINDKKKYCKEYNITIKHLTKFLKNQDQVLINLSNKSEGYLEKFVHIGTEAAAIFLIITNPAAGFFLKGLITINNYIRGISETERHNAIKAATDQNILLIKTFKKQLEAENQSSSCPPGFKYGFFAATALATLPLVTNTVMNYYSIQFNS